MAITRLYHTCKEKIQQIRPRERVTRVRMMAWLVTGLFMSSSIHLSHIARKLPGESKNVSKVKALSRFLNNRHVRVRDWYEPIAKALLQEVVAHGLPVRLLVDGTKVGNGYQLLMVTVAYRHRALPLVWTWVKGNRGHSSAYKQRTLLASVHKLMPEDAVVLVAGDSEFGAIDVLKQLDAWNWGYALRQKGNRIIQSSELTSPQRCHTLVTGPGQSQWLEGVKLTGQHAYPCHFLASWQAGVFLSTQTRFSRTLCDLGANISSGQYPLPQ